MSIDKRLMIVKVLMAVIGIVFLVMAVAHFFFTETYMTSIMHFASYHDSMVKLFSVTCVLLFLLAAFIVKDPLRNRDMVISFVVTQLLMSGTFFYFILFSDFPTSEYGSAISMLVFPVLIAIVYPWKEAGKLKAP